MATEGILSGVTKTEIAGIPVGAAAAGALGAGLVDALSGFLPAVVPSWGVKAIGSYVAITWGPKLLGKTAAEVAGLLLAYDAVQEFFNIRASVSNIFSGVVGSVVKRSPPVALGAGGVVGQAEKVAANYYNRPFVR